MIHGALRGRVRPRENAMHDTLARLEAIPFPAIRRGRLATLQVNLGYRCNQSCFHCHVNAGPNRTEAMDSATIDLVVEVVASMPCYLEGNVDAQRGKGVFDRSILGLRKLNAVGYGDRRRGLVLNLVFNPQ